MRHFIDLVTKTADTPKLTESPAIKKVLAEDPPRPTKTRTRTPLSLNLPGADDVPVLAPGDHPMAPRQTRTVAAARPQAEPPVGDTVSSARGREMGMRGFANVRNRAGVADVMANIQNDARDEIDDAEAARRARTTGGARLGRNAGVDMPPRIGRDQFRLGGPETTGRDLVPAGEPARPENLPAVVSDALTTGGRRFSPEWIKVANLPGYTRSNIRAAARQMFQQFTNHPLEDIQMIATAIHGDRDVQNMMGYIRQNGQPLDMADITFTQVAPGFQTDVQMWRWAGYDWLLTHDVGGFYVYGWPMDPTRRAKDEAAALLPAPRR